MQSTLHISHSAATRTRKKGSHILLNQNKRKTKRFALQGFYSHRLGWEIRLIYVTLLLSWAFSKAVNSNKIVWPNRRQRGYHQGKMTSMCCMRVQTGLTYNNTHADVGRPFASHTEGGSDFLCTISISIVLLKAILPYATAQRELQPQANILYTYTQGLHCKT